MNNVTDELILVRAEDGSGGWSLHAPGSTEIAEGYAPVLLSGVAERIWTCRDVGARTRCVGAPSMDPDDYSAPNALILRLDGTEKYLRPLVPGETAYVEETDEWSGPTAEDYADARSILDGTCIVCSDPIPAERIAAAKARGTMARYCGETCRNTATRRRQRARSRA